MDCGIAGGLFVPEVAISGLREAADVVLNSGDKATFIRGEAQHGCCIAGTLWTEPLVHAALPFFSHCGWLT
jgi:hypothetical protein